MPVFHAYSGHRDRPFRPIVTGTQCEVLRASVCGDYDRPISGNGALNWRYWPRLWPAFQRSLPSIDVFSRRRRCHPVAPCRLHRLRDAGRAVGMAPAVDNASAPAGDGVGLVRRSQWQPLSAHSPREFVVVPGRPARLFRRLRRTLLPSRDISGRAYPRHAACSGRPGRVGEPCGLLRDPSAAPQADVGFSSNP